MAEDRVRRQLAGPGELEAALGRGEPVRLVLVRDGAEAELAALLTAARAAGAIVRTESAATLRRMSRVAPPAEVLALVGPPPAAELAELLTRAGAIWLLVGLRYPGNTGYAVRTAEVSGAAGVVIDDRLLESGHRQALRASMRADRYLPVVWRAAEEVLALAEAAGLARVAVENAGGAAPWELDLTAPSVFVLGGETDGIPPDVLARCEHVVRVPMSGFIPCYNVQAAMAAVASERLRQLGD